MKKSKNFTCYPLKSVKEMFGCMALRRLRKSTSAISMIRNSKNIVMETNPDGWWEVWRRDPAKHFPKATPWICSQCYSLKAMFEVKMRRIKSGTKKCWEKVGVFQVSRKFLTNRLQKELNEVSDVPCCWTPVRDNQPSRRITPVNTAPATLV